MTSEVLGSTIKENDLQIFCQIQNLEFLDIQGHCRLPETATLKDIKDFQEQVDTALREAYDAFFKKA